MKVSRFFLCAGLSLLLCGISNAQIQVEQDGGIKIGTKPVVMGLSQWCLSSKGFEVNVGDVRFCASNGTELRFSAYVKPNKAGFIDPGGVSTSTEPTKFSQLTGIGLKVGSATSKVWEVYTHAINSDTIQEQEEEISNLEEEVLNLKEQLRTSEERIGRIEAMLESLGSNPEDGDAPGIMSTGGNQGSENMGYANGLSGQNSQTESAPLQQNGKSGEDNEKVIGARLWQNIPNPTNGNTVIRYELPANCKGRIVLTSSNGQTVRVFDLPQRAGIDEIEVNGQSITAGVYSYSLVVNGRSVDTKRMVLTR